MGSQRTLRIQLELEVTVLQDATVFQALTLAFWRFQGLAATTLFEETLRSIQERTRHELMEKFPKRFRHKGSRTRRWHLPFGQARLALVKLWDREARKVVWPLHDAITLPTRVQWCEETLVPGYHLAVVQSFRKGRQVLQRQAPDGRAPSHHTLHRRFQGFAERVDPVTAARQAPGPTASAYQMADGTRLKLQEAGADGGGADMRLVIGSRTPQGKLEVLDYSVGESWDAIGRRVRSRFPEPPRGLVSDGEQGIVESLAGPQTVIQRCLVHGRRELPIYLWLDGAKTPVQRPLRRAYARIPGLHLCQEELNRLRGESRATLEGLLQESRRTFAALCRRMPQRRFPQTRRYLTRLIADGLSALRHLLDTNTALLVSTNRAESLWSQVTLRLKRIGKRWSKEGGLHMLAACVTHALHPERFEAAEQAARGTGEAPCGVLITGLTSAWAS